MKNTIKVTNGSLTGSSMGYTLFITLDKKEAETVFDLAVMAARVVQRGGRAIVYRPASFLVVATSEYFSEEDIGEVTLVEESERPEGGTRDTMEMLLGKDNMGSFTGYDSDGDVYNWDGLCDVSVMTTAIWRK